MPNPKKRVGKKPKPIETQYDKALWFLIQCAASAQLRYDLKTYQIYELLKEAKLVIKHHKEIRRIFIERDSL